jgi:hypothetical protein
LFAKCIYCQLWQLRLTKFYGFFEDVALLTKETQFSFKTDESGTARLVRTAAKAFHPPGSDEARVAAYFASYLS